MDKNSKIYIAGHRGLAGSAIHRKLTQLGYLNIVTRTHAELDLSRQSLVEDFFKSEQPDYVFLAAAKVGGISANDKFRGDFILQNLEIQTNVIHSAFKSKVKKLLFLGSSCIYPKMCPQPMKEEYLLSGPLEPSNDAYAVAKISGLILCRSLSQQYGVNFVSAMPTNLYGPGDNYHLENSHVLPALIRKIHEAKFNNSPSVTAWGSGKPLREFLYSDDLADALVYCMLNYNDINQHINIGSSTEISILELMETIKRVVGYQGEVLWDATKPDGTPRKLMDNSKLFSLGWKPKVQLEEGIKLAYNDYLKNPRHG